MGSYYYIHPCYYVNYRDYSSFTPHLVLYLEYAHQSICPLYGFSTILQTKYVQLKQRILLINYSVYMQSKVEQSINKTVIFLFIFATLQQFIYTTMTKSQQNDKPRTKKNIERKYACEYKSNITMRHRS